MATKITLDNPTGASQWIADLGVEVENGKSIEVEDADIAARLLQNPIWKGRKPKGAPEPTTTDDETVIVDHTEEAE